ncbi:DJ-1/PfpI family protein [Streptomyces sp. NPDC057257]|uniref:DJ-1/PfpI family protein n=1 Tax=Streptomyces sp. NPDC057257 TaxID=3346071 RepID=UPI0036254C78
MLFEGVEELDAGGPWETLRFWQELTERDVVVRTASLDGRSVRCSLGLTFTSDGAIDDGPRPDLLVHPGGAGVDTLREDQTHLSRLRSLAADGTLLASVCNGFLAFAAAGLLAGLPATSHCSEIDDLVSRHPDVDVRTGPRWIDTGQIVTSAGVAAGIDMALHLIDRLEGTGMAQKVSHVLEYPWSPEASTTIPAGKEEQPDWHRADRDILVRLLAGLPVALLVRGDRSLIHRSRH